MVSTPKAKHIAYKGRRYRIVEGVLYQWRTMDNSYHMAWRPFVGAPELEQTIRQIAERQA